MVAYRAEHDPHGQRLLEWSDVSTNLDSHKFTGHEWDSATNLEYAKARMLSHNRGRFMQPDRLGLGAARASRPQTLNRYGYVHNDPINFVDRNGLEAEDPETIRMPPTWAPYPGERPDPRDFFDDFFRPEEPNPEVPTGPGGPDPQDVVKTFALEVNCNKTAEEMMSDIKANFQAYGNYAGSVGPGGTMMAAVSFAPGTITEGRTINIPHTVVLPSVITPAGVVRGIAIPYTSQVVVVSTSATAFVFNTVEGHHPFFPATITFSANNLGNGKISFSIDVKATFASPASSIFFSYLGGKEFEAAVWGNFLKNVEKECGR